MLDTSIDIFSFDNIILYTFTQAFLRLHFKPSSCTDPSTGNCQVLSEIERRKHSFDVLYCELGEESALVKLAQDCLKNDPCDRPSAGDLVDRINAALTSGPGFQSKVEVMRQLSRVKRKNERLQDEILSLQVTLGSQEKQIKDNLEKKQMLKQVLVLIINLRSLQQ